MDASQGYAPPAPLVPSTALSVYTDSCANCHVYQRKHRRTNAALTIQRAWSRYTLFKRFEVSAHRPSYPTHAWPRPPLRRLPYADTPFQKRRRSMAAAVIQRAFRAWRDRFEDLFYIHIKCTATAEEDELYRATLLISLAEVNVRLKWIEFDQLRMGRKSQLGKFAASQNKRRSLVVLGSHG